MADINVKKFFSSFTNHLLAKMWIKGSSFLELGNA